MPFTLQLHPALHCSRHLVLLGTSTLTMRVKETSFLISVSCYGHFLLILLKIFIMATNHEANIPTFVIMSLDPSDSLIIFGRLGMGLTLTFATPVVTLPCREALLQLISQTLILWRKPHEELKSFASPEGAPLTRSDEFKLDVTVEKGSYSTFGEDHIHDVEMDTKSTDDDEAHTPKEDDQRDDRHPLVHIGATLMITVYAFFTAVSVPGVAVVWSVLGSSLGMVIGFIIPCACYLKIRGKKGMMRNKSIGAMALLIFSIVVAILCTVQTLLGFM